MLDLTNYLIANPLVAAGLGILLWLVLHNLHRGQLKVAIGMALLICVTVFYLSRQILGEAAAGGIGPEGEPVEMALPPEPPG